MVRSIGDETKTMLEQELACDRVAGSFWMDGLDFCVRWFWVGSDQMAGAAAVSAKRADEGHGCEARHGVTELRDVDLPGAQAKSGLRTGALKQVRTANDREATGDSRLEPAGAFKFCVRYEFNVIWAFFAANAAHISVRRAPIHVRTPVAKRPSRSGAGAYAIPASV
jgi:hypothetical protein